MLLGIMYITPCTITSHDVIYNWTHVQTVLHAPLIMGGYILRDGH